MGISSKAPLLALLAILLLPAGARAEWVIDREMDPFTDKETISAKKFSLNGALVARCKDRDFSLFIVIMEPLGGDPIRYRYRLDKQPVVERKGLSSVEGLSVFIVFAASHARAMMSAETLLFEAFDERGMGHRRSFSMDGSKAAIGGVLSACGERLDGPKGISMDIVEEIDSWRSESIIKVKERLKAKDSYSGEINDERTDELYSVLQSVRSDYIDYCEDKEVRDILDPNCTLYVSPDERILAKSLVRWIEAHGSANVGRR